MIQEKASKPKVQFRALNVALGIMSGSAVAVAGLGRNQAVAMRQHAICKTCPYSLTPELVKEIALCLLARDISSLARPCKRFYDIVGGSLPIALSWQANTIHYRISHGTIFDHMESLERWEASRIDLGRYLSTAPLRLVIPGARELLGLILCQVSDDYVFAVHWQVHPTGLHQSALLQYVVLCDVLHTGQHS